MQAGGNAASFSGSFTFPRLEKVVHGPGSIGQVAAEIDRLGARKAFIVTGRTISGKTGFVDRLQTKLGNRFAGCFGRMLPHTPQECVLEAAAAAREVGADLLVSLGGGSSVDGAKMVALCLAEGITRLEEFAPYEMRLVGGATVSATAKAPAVPHIAIPTTLSGGEFSGFAGSTDAASGSKGQYKHPDMAPRVVIQDPNLTAETPGWLWGSTGMRSVDHCVEAIYSTSHQPFADALAIEALRLLSSNLVAAAADPPDVAARGKCQLASWMSLYSLSNVMVGLSHAIGHQLGGQCNVPHGVTSCLTLAAVMDFNRSASAARQAIAARAMGLDTADLSDDEAAAAAADRVRSLVRELGISNRLRDWNVAEGDIAPLAEGTMHEFLLATNPRKVTGPEDVESILRQVF